MKNIILIGMPSCGKTTIGRIISARLNRPFYDSDVIISERTGHTPREIITSDGESSFRDIETDIIKDLSALEGTIIATGGGTVIREENVISLRKNGVIVFVDRSPEMLLISPSRPLSDSREKLTELYRTRHAIYSDCADIIVNGDKAPDRVADCILSELKGKI